MAASRLFQVARLGTVGAMAGVPFLISKVHALDDQCRSRKMKISELPIYSNPEEGIQYTYTTEEISEFRNIISMGRQTVWDYFSMIEDTTTTIKGYYEILADYLNEHVTFLQDNPGALSRAGVITLAGLGGIVAGYRGGRFRKVLFSASAMTAAAAMCYPDRAVEISTTAYEHSYALYQSWDGKKDLDPETCECERKPPNIISWFERKTEVDPAKMSDDEIKEANRCVRYGKENEVESHSKCLCNCVNENTKEEPVQSSNTSVEQKQRSTNPVLEDYGQSNPADKDMYTTRGR